MPTDTTVTTVLKYTAYVGLLAVLFVPLVVDQSMFFLYITGKAYTFRILVEIIFALWLVLILRDRSYIPKRSWILGAAAIFVVIIGIADLAGVEPLRSIWSNYERMEGFVWIAHLFLFLISAAGIIGQGSVEDRRKLWAVFAHVSLLVSIIMGVYGLSQLSGKGLDFRIDAYLGNSTYLGVYALVHFFIAFYFWMRNAYHIHHIRSSQGAWKVDSIIQLIGYSALALFNLYIMYQTGTRGSLVGLVAGLGFIALAIAVLDRTHRAIRNTGIALLAIVIASVVTLGAMKDSDFVKSRPLIARFSALATFDVKGVFMNEGRARSLLWGIAYEGFKENPLLGWGQDNFGYVFSKHYNPEMYGQETWFDRTHNVIFDWLISAGLLGLLSYLSLFAAVLFVLWKKMESGGFELYEKAVLTGLLVAYFVHNLFVFDNLSSYIFFFSLLAFVHTIVGEKPLIMSRWSSGQGAVLDIEVVNYVATPIILIALGFGIYFINIPGIKANTRLIEALTDCNYKEYALADASFRDVLAYGAYEGLAQTREQFVFCASAVHRDPAVSADVKDGWMKNAQKLIDEQVKITPDDSRPFFIAGTFFSGIGRYDLAQPYLERAAVLSPGKQHALTLLALVYLNTKQEEKGVEILASMHQALPGNVELAAGYASALVYTGKADMAEAMFGATSTVMTDDQVIQVYEGKKMYSKVIEAYRVRAARTPDDVRTAIAPAVLYLKYGDRSASIRELKVLQTRFPSYTKDLQQLIDVINTGKNPFTQ